MEYTVASATLNARIVLKEDGFDLSVNDGNGYIKRLEDPGKPAIENMVADDLKKAHFAVAVSKVRCFPDAYYDVNGNGPHPGALVVISFVNDKHILYEWSYVVSDPFKIIGELV